MEAAIREVDAMFDRDVPSEILEVNPLTVQSIVDSQGLNLEQARAFSIVAQHSQSDNKKPLRMYLGRAGGTGKSRVINAQQDFSKSHGQERRFRLASYTGVAARNISGMTLHAALMLGGQYRSAKSAKAKRELMAMWEGIDYLFIDEISMVGYALLNDISHALSVAKGNYLAFGGINVVFAGDFAQLPPVGQTHLYSHLDKKAIAKAATKTGQKVVFGKLLWLSVDTVVMLHQNMRQTGPENQPFVELLRRLREGRCT
jgi:ATP-dependent exoDNAse (exonuclease V) alpha subunit